MNKKSEMNPMPSGEKVNINEHFGFGFLKNGNPTGNYLDAPRCNARAKRSGLPCRQPAMKNGKCRLHGGLSTGPKTVEGLNQSRKGNWKHGNYSQETKQQSKVFRELSRNLISSVKSFEKIHKAYLKHISLQRLP